MNTGVGMSQVLRIKKEIDELLAQGYTKIYIYRKLIHTKKIKLGQKRFYEILRLLEMKKVELKSIYFPGKQIIDQTQPDPMKEVMPKKRKRTYHQLNTPEEKEVYFQQKQVSHSLFQQHNQTPSELV